MSTGPADPASAYPPELVFGGGSGGGLATPIPNTEGWGAGGWAVETGSSQLVLADPYESARLTWTAAYPPGDGNLYTEEAYDGEHWAWDPDGGQAYSVVVKTPGWYRVMLHIARVNEFSEGSHFAFKSSAEGNNSEFRFPFFDSGIYHAASLVTCVPETDAPAYWDVWMHNGAGGQTPGSEPGYTGALMFMPLTPLG